jgi:xanthine dehydrogenase YagR molybdenum-binding subunit
MDGQPGRRQGRRRAAIVGAAAAIANAVHHATGARVCDLPIRIEKILV